MMFTQNTYTYFIDTIRKEMEEHAESLTYARSREMFRKQLSAICAEHGCQFLGFNLVRMLHKKLGVDIPENNDEVTISGHTFARENIAKPSAISNEDKEKYACILAQVACTTGNWPMTEELATVRFCTLLKDNLYLENDLKTTREVNRKDILNVARSLAFSYQDTNELLFRTLECGVLTDTSAADLIERFIIENNQSVLEREEMFAEYSTRTQNIRPTPIDRRKDNITQVVRDTFYETFLSKNKDICYKDRRNLCLEYLVKNARFLDAPNRTAANIYSKLLVYIRDAMNGDYDEHFDDKTVFERLRTILITSRTDWVLPKEEQIPLVQALLASEDCDTLNEAYTSWSVPSVNTKEGTMGKIELGTRMERIVTGDTDIQIQKKDLLFALFLACSLSWESDEQADLVVLRARLDRFINLANELLRKAYIENERFYLPHPMESSIATAIMCGPLAEGVFRDVTEELSLLGDRIKTNSQLSRLKLPPRVTGETTNLPVIRGKEKKAYDNLHDSVMTAMQQLRHGADGNEILWEAADIAQKIRDVWKKHNFRSIEIYFHQKGTWGFIPTASIGKDYEEVGKTPKRIQDILYGNQKVQVVFSRPDGARKCKFITLQEWIDKDTPKLDTARIATLHRKAVMYIILGQLEVFCGLDSIRINKKLRGFDFAELINEYDGDEKTQDDDKDAEAHAEVPAAQKLVLQCNAQVMGRRFMKIRGFSMETLEITDKPKHEKKKD